MNEQYKQYFEAMPGYLSVQESDLNILAANERFRRDFGDHTGRRCYQMYKHSSEKCESCVVDRTFRDGRGQSGVGQIRTADGRELSVIVYTRPIRDDEGRVVSVLKLSADITEIRQIEHELRESQQRYRLLFEEVPCYISIQDPNLRIVEANRNFKEAFGSFLGCKCYEIYKHRTEECYPCPVQRTFEDGRVHHSEEVVEARDGRQIHTLVYSAPIRDASGEIMNVMEMSADITPIRQLQTQLEGIGMLISSVSHGVKGLLNGLDGGMYLVNSGMAKDKPDRVKQGWEMVERNVDRIRGQVMNILYYAKERVPNREPLEILDLTEEVFGILTDKAQELGVSFDKEFDPATGVLDADRQAMSSMLVNLLENALDACRVDKKKPDHRVTFKVRGQPKAVLFEIADDGIGMDQETRDKAFSVFFSSKGAKGTGLGLFIAQKIAKAHFGDIEVGSELDKGTRFIVT
ncbi:MAG: PAS domain-containing sensor histidine kinase, partial [Deltaproteobacteria bacterium]|nr:PAS domain-containing sensor histidine kinase [Deltaproteobacteria bacterium]